MLIIGVLSSVVLPTLQNTLKDHPRLHETILQAYLGCLLVGDVSRAPAQRRTLPLPQC